MKMEIHKKISERKDAIQRVVITASMTIFVLGIFFSSGIIAPHIAEAQNAQNFSAFTVLKECTTKECKWPEFLKLLNESLKFLVFLAIAGATIAIAWGGLDMVMNMGNSGKISEGKKRIQTAVTGLILTLAVWLIMKFLLDLIGVAPWVRSFIG